MKFKRTFVIDEKEYKEFTDICYKKGMEKSAQIRILIQRFNKENGSFKIFK